MTNRDRARQILTQCRDVLTERLVERVLDSQDELLDDARGDSYGGEIDALQEQLGVRLQAVNQLLGQLPMDDPAFASEPAHPVIVDTVMASHSMQTGDSTQGNAFDSHPVAFDEPSSFQLFIRQVLAGDLPAAGLTLEPLLGLGPLRARECAERFSECLRNQPGFLSRAMGLRSELASGSINTALELLSECFGLDGLESAVAWRRLTEQR